MARLENLVLFVFICGNVSVVAVSNRFLPLQRRVSPIQQLQDILSDSEALNVEFPEIKDSYEPTLSELKRAFAILDKMSDPSQVSRNHEVPIAWYEPLEDDAERSYDEGECVDRFAGCQKYADNYQCQERKYHNWMSANCRKTCNFCHCWETKYGCCPDQKTPAEGPGKAGCGVKLCIDFRDCKKYKGYCDNSTISKELKTWLRNKCAYTCQYCRAPSPKDDCIARQPVYGCCWNGDEATGYNNEGCLPCEDNHQRACKLYKSECNSPFYTTRLFMETQCPLRCGQCGKCFDKQDPKKCARWETQGLCNGGFRPVWKAYMAENCAMTCGFCTNNASIGARSYLGL